MKELRDRAIKILENEDRSTKYLPIDYVIDAECRRVLNLPQRPNRVDPYVTWMVEHDEIPKSTQPVKISQVGLDLIKKWEGLRLVAYLCPGNVWTIGYGHTGDVQPGNRITQPQAESLLKRDLVRFENAVVRLVKVPINQNQFDALVSFVFNVGISAFSKSTLLRKLNQKRYHGASEQFGRWVFANGNKLPGLISRRVEEKALFLSKAQ